MTAGPKGLSQGDESPFLTEDLCSNATTDPASWRTHLTGLDTETPFLHDLATRQESRSTLAPGTLTEEELEPGYEYQTGVASATADAFVADADGKTYFATFPQLGD